MAVQTLPHLVAITSNLLGIVLVGPNIALVYDDHSPSGIFPLVDSQECASVSVS